MYRYILYTLCLALLLVFEPPSLIVIYSGNNDAWRLKISVHILLQKKAWHDYGWRNEGSNTPKTNENRQHTIQVRLNSAIKIFLISSLNQFLWWHCYKTVVTFYLWHISFQWKQNGKVLKALWRKVEREDENVQKETIHVPSVKKDRNNSNRPVWKDSFIDLKKKQPKYQSPTNNPPHLIPPTQKNPNKI